MNKNITKEVAKKWATTEIATVINLKPDGQVEETWQRWKEGRIVKEILKGDPKTVYVLEPFGEDSYRLIGTETLTPS